MNFKIGEEISTQLSHIREKRHDKDELPKVQLARVTQRRGTKPPSSYASNSVLEVEVIRLDRCTFHSFLFSFLLLNETS